MFSPFVLDLFEDLLIIEISLLMKYTCWNNRQLL